VVQDAIREVLQAIYEQDFLDCSHGFRPGRSAHDAIRALDRVVHRGEVNWILEADIVSFFDSLDRTELMKLIQIRVRTHCRSGTAGSTCASKFTVPWHIRRPRHDGQNPRLPHENATRRGR
jgi:hypothetical protein